MKKFEGILICTDLDGTLLRDDKSISAKTLEKIEYFKSEGGYFTFITGRMPFFVKNIYDLINPNAPFGCINGGGIYDHREMIGGLRFVHEPKTLRFFTGKLEPVSDWPEKLIEAYIADFGEDQ